MLERHVTATSPKGHTIKIIARRQLMLDKRECMRLDYEVQSINYAGPITILSILSAGDDAQKWYPLMNYVGDDLCWTWMQLQPVNMQVCSAMNYHLTKNGTLVTQRPIKVEKQDVIGFSLTQKVVPNDTLVLHKNVIVVDSLRYAKEQLIDEAVKCLTNL